MVRAKIITGGAQNERQKKAQELIETKLGSLLHPDLFTVEAAPSVTITQIREIKRRIAMKPYSASMKIIFVPEAEKITYPAQNAFLKTLEEPPGEAIIILVTPKKDFLLPTIISRCEVIHLPEKAEIELDQKLITYHLSLITQVLKSRVGERLILAEKIASNREEGIKFCQNQLIVWRQILRQKRSGEWPASRRDSPGVDDEQRWKKLAPKQITQTLRQIHQSLTMLEANVNPRLVIENLLLTYPQSKKV